MVQIRHEIRLCACDSGVLGVYVGGVLVWTGRMPNLPPRALPPARAAFVKKR
nr:MAG TPA: hypothetical protein [Caudoviricetes sp.]